jgi:hypothetical protein
MARIQRWRWNFQVHDVGSQQCLSLVSRFFPVGRKTIHEITRNRASKAISASCYFVDRFTWKAAPPQNKTPPGVLYYFVSLAQPLRALGSAIHLFPAHLLLLTTHC